MRSINSDIDTFKLATVLDKTEKYMIHIKYLRLAMEAGYRKIPPISPTLEIHLVKLVNFEGNNFNSSNQLLSSC